MGRRPQAFAFAVAVQATVLVSGTVTASPVDDTEPVETEATEEICFVAELGPTRLTAHPGRDTLGAAVGIEPASGAYRVVLTSEDLLHDDPTQLSQPSEIWLLEGLDETGSVIVESGPTDDLPDDETSRTTDVGLLDMDDVVAVRARHADIKPGSPNSIVAMKATFLSAQCEGGPRELLPDEDEVKPAVYEEDTVSPLVRKPPIAAEFPDAQPEGAATPGQPRQDATIRVSRAPQLEPLESQVADHFSSLGVASVAPPGLDSDGVEISIDTSLLREEHGLDDEAMGRLGFSVFRGCLIDDAGPTCTSSEPMTTTRAADGTMSTVLTADPQADDAAPANDQTVSVVAVITALASEEGNYAAAPFATIQDFEVSLGTGALQSTYPIPVPDAAAGPSPVVELSYFSQRIDGLTNATNPQTGPIGIGWALSEASITRSVPPGCVDEAGGDLCHTEYYNISLNGVSSPLVNVAGQEFRLQDDPRWRVIHHPDPTDPQGEWWEVVVPDGTRHVFGMTVDSVDWAPLRHTTSPPTGCVNYRPDGSPASADGNLCTRAYRWHLSSMADRAGNEVRYHYAQEHNSYFAEPSAGDPILLRYVRASRLEEISYTHHPAMERANARVRFNYEWRCGTTEDFGPCGVADSWPQRFPDTPSDFDCEGPVRSGCTIERRSPTFWSQMRLGSITTQIRGQGDRYHSVATYDIVQGFPDADAHRDDWINDYGAKPSGGTSPKPAVYRIHQRPSGRYEHWGWGQIEAEDADADEDTTSTPSEPKPATNDIGGGTASPVLGEGDVLSFNGVYLHSDAADAGSTLYARISSTDPGTISFRIGSPEASPIASFDVDTAGAWSTFSQELTERLDDTVDLYVTADTPGIAAQVNWFRFDAGGSEAFLDIPSLPPTEYVDDEVHFAWLPNRVNPVQSPLVFPRIERVINPFGGVTTYTYGQPEQLRCGGAVWTGSNDGTINPGSETDATPGREDTSLCYPQFTVDIEPDERAEEADAGFVLWHRWVVLGERTDDPYTDNDDRIVRYDYGTPRWSRSSDPTLWDLSLGLCDTKVFDDFRGFDETTVDVFGLAQGETDLTPISRETTRFFQGLDREPQGALACNFVDNGGTRSVTYHGGEQQPDSFWLRGRPYQVDATDPDDGEIISRQEFRYDAITDAGADAGLADRRFVYVAERSTRLQPDTIDVETRSVSEYDEFGRPTSTTDFGDTSTTDDDAKVTWTYLEPNLDAWVLDSMTSEVFTDLAGQDAGLVSKTEMDFDADRRLATIRSFSTPTEYSESRIAERDDQWRATVEIDELGRRSSTTYDPEHGSVIAVANHLEPAWVSRIDYDELARPVMTTNHRGERTHLRHDRYSRESEVWRHPRNPTAAPSIEFTYGDTPTNRGVRWVSTSTLFDDTTDPAHYLDTTSYFDGFGREVQTDRPSPSRADLRTVTNATYDAAGRVRRQSAPFEQPAGREFLDNNWATVDSHLATTYRTDNRLGAIVLTGSGSSDRGTTRFDYDGLVRSTTDPRGNRSDLVLDAKGRTAATIDYVAADDGAGPLEAFSTTYTYDVAGRVVSINPPGPGQDGSPDGDAITFSYDLLGRQTTSTDPNRGTETVTHDVAGRVTGTDGARGDEDGDGLDDDRLTYRYDEMDNLVALSLGDHLLSEYRYQLRPGDVAGAPDFALGDLIQSLSYDYRASDRRSTEVWRRTTTGWDAHHRPVSSMTEVGGQTFAEQRSLLEGGAVETLTYPDGETLRYTYNHAGLADTAAADRDGFEVVSTDYDFAGRVIRQDFGSNGANRSFDYDPGTLRLRRSLAGFTDPSVPGGRDVWQIQHHKIRYDPSGNIESVVDYRNPAPVDSGGQNHCYRYDAIDRLVQAWTNVETDSTSCADDAASSFTDEDGTTITLDPGTTYDQAFSYGPDGNIERFESSDPATATSVERRYDYRSDDPADGGPNAVHSIRDGDGREIYSASFDPAGNQVSRTQDGTTQSLVYDEHGRLEVVSGRDGEVRFLYDTSGQRVATIEGGQTTVFIGTIYERSGDLERKYYHVSGDRVAMSEGGVLLYLFDDYLNSTNAVFAPDRHRSPADVVRQRYLPFGDRRGTSGIEALTAMTSGFTGKRLDSTGLLYFEARYYDPLIGRFIQPDPIVAGSGTQRANRYSYVLNNPARWTDPTGLLEQCASIDIFSQILCAAGIGQVEVEEFNEEADRQKSSFLSDFARQTGSDIWAIPSGIFNTVAHPIESAKGIAGCVGSPRDCGRAVFADAAQPCTETAGRCVARSFTLGFEIGATILGGGGTLASKLSKLRKLKVDAPVVQGPYRTVTVERLRELSALGGRRTRVVTSLDAAPEPGRPLSTATGDAADDLASAANPGGTRFEGEVPVALIDELESMGLATRSTTEMYGVVGQEIRFSGDAVDYIIPFLSER